MRRMHAAGQLPPMPPELKLSDVNISIDPHQSIHGMVDQLQREVMDVMARAGFWAVRNETGRPFITSDNPVIWFDPNVPEDEVRPYAIKLRGDFILVFPVSPILVIFGSLDSASACCYKVAHRGEIVQQPTYGSPRLPSSGITHDISHAYRCCASFPY